MTPESYDLVWPTADPRQSASSDSVADSSTTDSATAELPVTTYACYCYDFIVEAVFMGALCLFGFAGNTVATVCLRRDRSKTATPFLLVSLEVADTLFLVAVFGLRVLTSIDTFAFRLPWLDPAVPFIGKFVYPAALVAETGTIYLTILVTFNRYVSVCWPYRASDWCSVRCARRHVLAVAAFSVAFNLPRFFEYDIVSAADLDDSSSADNVSSSTTGNETGGHVTVGAATVLQLLFQNSSSSMLSTPSSSIWPTSTSSAVPVDDEDDGGSQRTLRMTAMADHRIYRLVYTNLLYCFVMFLFPLVSLMFLNQRLIVALRRTKKKRQRLTGSGGSAAASKNSAGDANRSEEDITFMLIVVVMVFVVTQTPAAVTQIVESWLDERSTRCPSAYFFYVRISDLLVVANSSLNFVVYCLCSRRFRQILTDVVCRCPSAADANDGFDGRRGAPPTTNGCAGGGGCGRGFRRAGRGGPPVAAEALQTRRGTTTTRFDVTAAVPLTRPLAAADDNDLISRV